MCLVHRRLLLHGVQPDLQKFSKVSALVHIPYKGTIKRGFENVCVHWVQPDLKRAWDQCRKSSTTTSPATRQKRPENTAKETYNAPKEPYNVTKEPYYRQKSPATRQKSHTIAAKEPYYRGKRALLPRQKSPTTAAKETCMDRSFSRSSAAWHWRCETSSQACPRPRYSSSTGTHSQKSAPYFTFV